MNHTRKGHKEVRLPDFKLIPASEAAAKTATGKRAQLLQEYLGYIQQLQNGQAGTLRPSVDESLSTVRRRLGKAANATGKELVIKRTGEEVIFWERASGQPGRRKPGRPRKNPLSS